MAYYNNILITDHFSSVGVVTTSCDSRKMEIAVQDALTFDMEPILCHSFIHKILTSADQIKTLKAREAQVLIDFRQGSIDESVKETRLQEIREDTSVLDPFIKLLEGCTYVACNGLTKSHQGLLRVWAMYAYSHYVRVAPVDDTPNGLVHKTNDYSMPLTTAELTTISTNYRNKAKFLMDQVRDFLCINKSVFLDMPVEICALSCGCEGSCKCGQPKKIRGIKYKSIRK